jgi:hypothetical protein
LLLENLKTKDGYEEDIYMVFRRFAFTRERRVVASPTDRQYGEGCRRNGTAVASVAKDK